MLNWKASKKRVVSLSYKPREIIENITITYPREKSVTIVQNNKRKNLHTENTLRLRENSNICGIPMHLRAVVLLATTGAQQPDSI